MNAASLQRQLGPHCSHDNDCLKKIPCVVRIKRTVLECKINTDIVRPLATIMIGLDGNGCENSR